MKVADDTPYVMSVKFNNLSGKRCEGVVSKVCGNIGLIFNFWDYTNYDFIYKGYSKQRVPTAQQTSLINNRIAGSRINRGPFDVGFKGWDMVHGVNTRPLVCRVSSARSADAREARFYGEL